MKAYKFAVLGLLSASLLVSPHTAIANDSITEKENEIKKGLDSLKKETETTKKQKELLQQQLTAAQTEINATKNSMDVLQQTIDALDADILATTAAIARLENNIIALNAEIEVITKELKAQEKILGQTISFLYEVSDVSYVEFFFQSENIEELFNTHEFIETIMDENDEVYKKILASKEKLSKKKEELTLSKLSLNAKRKQNEQMKLDSINQKNSLNALLTAKQQEQMKIFEQIKAEEMREQQASTTIIQYIEQLDYLKKLTSEDPNGINLEFVGTPFKASKRLVTPLPGYQISSDFGMRFHPVLQYSRMHNGVDLAGQYGETIYSSGDGVVVFAGPASGYGNWIVIYHGTFDGKEIYSIYAHMESNQIAVSSKQVVKQGQPIAQVGNAGTSTGPHLHFGVAQGFNGGNFNFIDPKLFMDFK